MSNRNLLQTLAIASLLLCPACLARAADHLDAPLVQLDGRTDINDLYVFQSPTNPNNTVLIQTVNPLAGQLSGTTFDPAAVYEFQVDNNGDAVPDVTFSTFFSPVPPSGVQDIGILRNGIVYGSGSVNSDVTTTGGGTLRAGLFDDPFFFDLAGFQNGLNFTGVDFFAGLNVSAIILEIPSSELGGQNIGVSARTLEVMGSQIDRLGRPAINTVLIPSARKDEFNQADPDQDFTSFGADVQATIESLNGGDATHAAAVTAILLPDLLTFDTSSSAGFLNGRQLADDVIDAELNLLTNGGLTTGDGVGANDVPFPGVFPYLAPAHIPEPCGIALAILGLWAVGGRRRRSNCSEPPTSSIAC